MPLRTLGRRLAPALLFAAPLLGGCHNQCPVSDPYCHDPKVGAGDLWLFGYSASETDQILAKVRSDGGGLVGVTYALGPDGRQSLAILEGCQISGGYRFGNYPMIVDSLVMRSEDEARLKLPLTYATFSGAFKQSSVVEIKYQSPGAYEASGDAVSMSGDCGGLTHVVARVQVGAFETHVGNSTSVGASVTSAPGGNGGLSSSDLSDRRVTAGSFAACSDGPADQCEQPVSLRLREMKKVALNTESCVVSEYMSGGQGFAFDGKVFTVMSDQLAELDPEAKVHFACDAQVSDTERDALTKIAGFLDRNRTVKAHVSVRCSAASLMAFVTPSPDLHANQVRGLLASYVSAGKLTIDSCYVPGATGVYVELVSGCKEGSTPRGELACVPPGK